MPLNPTWQDIALRLALTVLAGAVIGFNREARGHAAGLRTTILVGLAASLSMIQANILLSTVGKEAVSFSVMDTLRLPLGVLTGVGFIGGGAILKRGNLVTGVTTAATLWVITAIGLCIGGGQLVVGIAATAIAALVLWLLKAVDLRIRREQRARLVLLTSKPAGQMLEEINGKIRGAGCRARFLRYDKGTCEPQHALSFELSWKRRDIDDPPLGLIAELQDAYAVASFEIIAETGR